MFVKVSDGYCYLLAPQSPSLSEGCVVAFQFVAAANFEEDIDVKL